MGMTPGPAVASTGSADRPHDGHNAAGGQGLGGRSGIPVFTLAFSTCRPLAACFMIQYLL
jgi:hypothetical protein